MSTNILTATRQRRAAANASHAWANAIAALRVAESAVSELASVLDGLRPDEFKHANLEPRSALDAASIAWNLEWHLAVLDGNTPPGVRELLRAEPTDSAAAAVA